MKKNKGFTLIELLAVLVILAIIALIITPIVTNLIKDARIKSAENATEGLLEAVHVYYGRQVMLNNGVFNDNKKQTIEFDGAPGGNSEGTVDGDTAIEFNGFKVTDGSLTIDRYGKVKINLKNQIRINGYYCVNTGEKVVCDEEEITVPKTVYAKLCDENRDNAADTLILDNNLDFSCSGNLIKDYDNKDDNEYYATSYGRHLWDDDSSIIKHVVINNLIVPSSLEYYFKNMPWEESIDFSMIDPSDAKNVYGMLYNNKATFIDLSGFDTSEVFQFSRMFWEMNYLTAIEFGDFDTSSATQMIEMFRRCTALTELDLSSFDTSNVTSMEKMFMQDGNLEKIYVSENFRTNLVTNSDNMFSSVSKLVGGNGTRYSSSYTDKTYARVDKPGEPGYFTLKN